MEQRWALCLVLAVVAGVPTQARRIPRSTAVSGAVEGEQLDYLQKESGSLGESNREKSYTGHSKGKNMVDNRYQTVSSLGKPPSLSTRFKKRGSRKDSWTSENDSIFRENLDAVKKGAFTLLYGATDSIEFPWLLTKEGSGDDFDLNELLEFESSIPDMEFESKNEMHSEDLPLSSKGLHEGYVTSEYVNDEAATGFSKTPGIQISGKNLVNSFAWGDEERIPVSRRAASNFIQQFPGFSEEGTERSLAPDLIEETEMVFQEPLHNPILSGTWTSFESDGLTFRPLGQAFGEFLHNRKHTSTVAPEKKFANLRWEQTAPSSGYVDEVGRTEEQATDSVGEKDVLQEVLNKLLKEKENSLTEIKRKVFEDYMQMRLGEPTDFHEDENPEMELNEVCYKHGECSEDFPFDEQNEQIDNFNTLLQQKQVSVEELREKLKKEFLKLEHHDDILPKHSKGALLRQQKQNFEDLLRKKKLSAPQLKRYLEKRLARLQEWALQTSLRDHERPRKRVDGILQEPELDTMAAYMGDSENGPTSSSGYEQPRNPKTYSRTKEDLKNLNYRDTRHPWHESSSPKNFNKNSSPVYAFLKQFSKLCKAQDRFYGNRQNEKSEKHKWKWGENPVLVEECDEESYKEQLILSRFNETCNTPRGNEIAKFIKAQINSQLAERLTELKPMAKLVIKLTLYVSEQSNIHEVSRFEQFIFYDGFLEEALKFEESQSVSAPDLTAEMYLEKMMNTPGMEALQESLRQIGFGVLQSLNQSGQVSGIMSLMVVMVKAIMLAASRSAQLSPLLMEEPEKSKKLIKTMLMEELFAQSVSNEFFTQISPEMKREHPWPLNEISVENADLKLENQKYVNDEQLRNTLLQWFSEANGQNLWKNPLSPNENIFGEESPQVPDEQGNLVGIDFPQRTPVFAEKFNKNKAGSVQSAFAWASEDESCSPTAQNSCGLGERDLLSEERCHNRDLRLCGKPALEKLQKEKEMKQRCRIREEFLTCMSKQRIKGCVTADDPQSTAPGQIQDSPDISMLRNELRKSFHNCVLSYTIPDQSLGL